MQRLISHIIAATRRLKVQLDSLFSQLVPPKFRQAECDLYSRDRWSPLHTTQNQPSGLSSVVVCTWPLSLQGRQEKKRGCKSSRGSSVHPIGPPHLLFSFIYLFYFFIYLFIVFFPLVPGCDGRSSSVGVGSRRRGRCNAPVPALNPPH